MDGASDKKPLVLFLCTANSARSQLAEALLRHKAGQRFDVASAGTDPTIVNPLTIRVLQELGLPTTELRSKPLTEFVGRVPVAFAILVCDRAQQSCPRIDPFCRTTLFWPFDDPANTQGSEPERLRKFREVRDQIAARIDAWLQEPSI